MDKKLTPHQQATLDKLRAIGGRVWWNHHYEKARWYPPGEPKGVTIAKPTFWALKPHLVRTRVVSVRVDEYRALAPASDTPEAPDA